MGGMMGTTGTSGAWIVLWIVLGVALLVTGGVVATRVLTAHRHAAPPPIHAEEPPGLQEARAALRMRYANGDIAREDYLQGTRQLLTCRFWTAGPLAGQVALIYGSEG